MGRDDFRQALSDFSFDVASGGAIRHLTDMGCTVKQIQEQLDFPTPYARVQETVWRRLVDTGTILLEDPRLEGYGEKVNFIREYDSFGKVSFRRVAEPALPKATGGVFLVCEFGTVRCRDAEKYRSILEVLDARQAEYVDGLPWPQKKVWHRADERMLEIAKRLEATGLTRGVCYLHVDGDSA